MFSPRKWLDLALPVGIIACLLVILVPLPAAVLDVLLAANITIAVIVLLTAIQVKTPLEFAIFPTLLLATTLSRLVLNIATTRLILSRGAVEQHAAAGDVVRSFGEFVAGNHVMVGAVIFAIIVVVQFVVITRGATRISEVAARFTLDGMPGRQMAIDADLNAGAIDAEEAARRREGLQEQADFYGAMDGASKYVRGDAIAGLLITGINILGGLAMGIAGGMSAGQAMDVFTRLTIGDGLVSQVPGLLISLAAGILVSRSTRPADLSRDFVAQLFSRAQVLLVAGAFLLILIFTQLPAVPLIVVGGACLLGSWVATGERNRNATGESATDEGATAQVHTAEPDFSRFLTIDPIEIELGVDLVSLAQGGELLQGITRARLAMADELGIVLPRVRVRDNLQLEANRFQIRINQLPACQQPVYVDRALVIGRERGARPPAEAAEFSASWHTGEAARWIPREHSWTKKPGTRRLEPVEVIVETLKHQARLHAADILTRQSTAFLIDQLRESSPATVDELVPDVLRIGQVQQVLQALLREGISIKPLNTILEALADQAVKDAQADKLVETVRRRLAPWISGALRSTDGRIRVVELHIDLQMWLGGRAECEAGQRRLALDERSRLRLRSAVMTRLEDVTIPAGVPVALRVPGALRAPLFDALDIPVSQLRVVATDELLRDEKIETIAILALRDVQYVAA